MTTEKVIRINLPDGCKYQRTEVTGKGGISIVYAEENYSIDSNHPISAALAKPEPLIGGSNVYQKDGLPYWYCRIKNGRDEFMYFSVKNLSKEDFIDSANGKLISRYQEFLFRYILKALDQKPKKGYCWVPVYEPSVSADGNLQYIEGQDVLTNLTGFEWAYKMNSYSPENGSKMATITTYFLLLLRLLKDGYVNVWELADDSTNVGNYWNSKDTKKIIDKTGGHQLGGLYGFAGNTRKIVKGADIGDEFWAAGGSFHSYGYLEPLANVAYYGAYYGIIENAIGMMELTC